MTGEPYRIRVIAICVFGHDDSILVTDAIDPAKDAPFHRPLGGGVEPVETSSQAISREIDEELGLEVQDLKLLGVLENIFTHRGEAGHEVVFVYDGRFCDASVYERRRHRLTGVEEDGQPIAATWRRLDSFDDHHRLVPEGLLKLLTDRRIASPNQPPDPRKPET